MTYVIGNVLDVLPTLPAGRFQTCVTSPPYWGLRDYDHPDQLGLEPTPKEFVDRMVSVFREVRRCLRDDGTLWLNIGDSYAGSGRGGNPGGKTGLGDTSGLAGQNNARAAKEKQKNYGRAALAAGAIGKSWTPVPAGLKRKELCGIESVTDRPTKAHEYVFLLAKKEDYFYDADAIREALRPKTLTTYGSTRRSKGTDALGRVAAHNLARDVPVRKPRLDADGEHAGANARSVWTIASKPYGGAHFATMPPELAQRCILAGSRLGDEVLDPFLGSGTTGAVAELCGRRWFGVELQPKYAKLIDQRTSQQGLFAGAAAPPEGGI